MKRLKRIFLFTLLGLLVLCLLAVAVSAISNTFLPPAPTITDRLESLDKSRLAEAIHLRQSLGDQVWPGFGQADIPLIVWNADYSFLVGLPDPPSPWEAVPDETFGDQPYYRRPSDDTQNFAVPVGEGWAASMATKSETDRFMMGMFRDFLPPVIESIFPYRLLIQPSEVQISALAHEAFHVFQQLNAPERLAAAEAAHSRGDAYWQADAGMGDDWQAEIDLLAQAVRAEDDEQARALVEQFLEARQRRRAEHDLSPELIDYERQLEWEEGLAKYIELAVWRAAYEHTGYIPLLMDDPDFKAYRTFPSRFNQEISQMRRQAKQEGEARLYYTGMAQAMLLDRLLPGWKDKVFEQGVWLEQLLNQP
jgi:hypothetical protein